MIAVKKTSVLLSDRSRSSRTSKCTAVAQCCRHHAQRHQSLLERQQKREVRRCVSLPHLSIRTSFKSPNEHCDRSIGPPGLDSLEGALLTTSARCGCCGCWRGRRSGIWLLNCGRICGGPICGGPISAITNSLVSANGGENARRSHHRGKAAKGRERTAVVRHSRGICGGPIGN